MNQPSSSMKHWRSSTLGPNPDPRQILLNLRWEAKDPATALRAAHQLEDQLRGSEAWTSMPSFAGWSLVFTIWVESKRPNLYGVTFHMEPHPCSPATLD